MNSKKLIYRLALVIAAVAALPLLSVAQNLTIASYNIRYNNPGDAEKGDGWEGRAQIIASQIKFFDFELMGVQEAMEGQLQDLDGFVENYDRIGVGRKDGEKGGEYEAIFYKIDRFRLLDTATFCISELPDIGTAVFR